METIRLTVSGGGGHIWLITGIILDIAKEHDGEVEEGRVVENSKKIKITADDEKIGFIRGALYQNKLEGLID